MVLKKINLERTSLPNFMLSESNLYFGFDTSAIQSFNLDDTKIKLIIKWISKVYKDLSKFRLLYRGTKVKE